MIPRRHSLILGLFALLAVVLPASADPPARRLKSTDLDALLARSGVTPGQLATDERFLRRVTLDLIGRPPTQAESAAFARDAAGERRSRVIERLLASPEFGKHWANYWTDAIASHVPPPELTFLSYREFRRWLTERFNGGAGWDAIACEMLAANGPVKKSPAVTFIGYHQGRPAKLAAETARLFLGVQLQCAECHDHKTEAWSREQFHGLAAYFGRVSGKLGKAQDGSSTEVKALAKGEYLMPHVNPAKKGKPMAPSFLDGTTLALGTPDAERRAALARLVTRPENPLFAKAYVNRMWARLMGRGFYEPVDNMGETVAHQLPEVHAALTAHFIHSGHDVKGLFRLLANSKAYQGADPLGRVLAQNARGAKKASHVRLSGDQVFRSLEIALGLPNVTPPAMKPTAEIRFPPPPKSTRDLVAAKFGHDPSLCPEEVARTLGQAMLLMNNRQVQAQINADPASGTRLSKLVQAVKDDRVVVVRLFDQVLARQPTETEIGVALEHVRTVGARGLAFEDLLWSLINSPEFTTRR